MKKIIPYADKYKKRVVDLIFGILENEFGRYSKSGRPDVKNIPEFYQKDEKNNFWIAVDENDNVVGTIALENLNGGCGNLRRLYVKKELRGTGLAKELLSVLLRFAKEKQYKQIFLSTWDEAIAANKFYLKNGFKRISKLPEEIAWDPGHDNVFYKLELK